MLSNEDIKKKEEKINSAKNILKSEFIGIDEQIDAIIDNFKCWYLFPELQSSPVIINLWGLTGVGKTSLIRRLIHLLNLEKDLVYFNFAEIGEMNSWEIESKLEEELGNENTNRVFVYDEFQYAATKKHSGEEKDNKYGLKAFWELLDTGVINRKANFWKNKMMYQIILCLDIISETIKPSIVNGTWINREECIKTLNPTKLKSIKNIININAGEKMGMMDCSYDIEMSYDNGEHLLKDYVINNLCKYDVYETRSLEEQVKLPERIMSMDFDDLYSYVLTLLKNLRKGIDLNFKNSIIFVLGNLDEAYDISFNVDPDMSPDQFHEITKKINIVDIKKALRNRFRNEQIARLGNIHLIYPSFNSDSFNKIIAMNLEKYGCEIKLRTGYDVTFSDSLKNLIYTESVFPTHGTRPIFSTIHELVKSLFPNAVLYIYNNNLDSVDRIYYTYIYGFIVVEFYSNGKFVGNIKRKPTSRLNKLRVVEKGEKQYITSVHEAGHFIAYCALNGKVPEKIRSKTVNSDNNGFMLSSIEDEEKVETYQRLKNKLSIILGGYAAEEYVFGKECITNGASSDLKNATALASNMVRKWAMSSKLCTSTYVYAPEANQNGGDVMFTKKKEEQINEEIESLLHAALLEVSNILHGRYRILYIEIVDYLIKNSEIDKKTMETMYNQFKEKYRIEEVECDDYIEKYNKFKSIRRY